MTRQAYPFRERAMVFCRALWKGRDPLLDVAAVGLCRSGLDEELQARYTERISETGLAGAMLLVGHIHTGACSGDSALFHEVPPGTRKLLSRLYDGRDRRIDDEPHMVFVSELEDRGQSGF